jgi:hypothetical protein
LTTGAYLEEATYLASVASSSDTGVIGSDSLILFTAHESAKGRSEMILHNTSGRTRDPDRTEAPRRCHRTKRKRQALLTVEVMAVF